MANPRIYLDFLFKRLKSRDWMIKLIIYFSPDNSENMVKTVSSKLSYVVKRDGRQEEVHFDKITSRLKKLCYGLNMDYVDPLTIMLKVVNTIYPGITTIELDTLTAETAITMSDDHPDYAILAARIAISNLQKQTKKHFSEVIDDLYKVTNPQSKEHDPKISENLYKIVTQNSDALNSCIIYDRDFYFNYYAFKTLEHSILLKINGTVVERPQHMFMRTAIAIHGEDIEAAIETYNLLSEHYYIHATPTLCSAASPTCQLMSAHQIMMPDDSIEGIYKCVRECGIISKLAGNVSVGVQNIRSKGSYIAGTNGISNGLVPMLRVFDALVPYSEQQDSLLPALLTIYIEPWHSDIYEFLDLGKPIGKDEVRARNLSYSLWIPDLFMRRVEENGMWSLMCPNNCTGLIDAYGETFDKLYEQYEAEGRYTRQIKAQDLWKAITVSQVETGGPSMLYKDACNKKSNQKNLGTIRSASHYSEVVAYTSSEDIASCCQASIAVSRFVDTEQKSFDFKKLKDVTKVVTKNLNKIVDVSLYALPEKQKLNVKNRPIGIGVQGLADTFILMKLPFDTEEASLLNKQIYETIYYGALEASCEIAKKDGPYDSYQGSPISKGILQYDMCNASPTGLWDWSALKETISKYGVRNSLLISQAPAVTGAYILGNNPGVEPYKSFIYPWKVNSGEFLVINQHLLRDLVERGIWDESMKEEIVANHGSIQDISNIPDELKALYKTAWEMSQKVIINMAADRGAFIDQSQCLNIFIDNPTYAVLSSVHFYSWRKGLKTGIYRLKIKPVVRGNRLPNKNKVEVKVIDEMKEKLSKEEEERNMASLVCSLRNPESCEMCGA